MSRQRRSLWLGGRLPVEILRTPPKMLHSWYVKPGVQLAYQQIDDERIVQNDDGPVDVLYQMGGGSSRYV